MAHEKFTEAELELKASSIMESFNFEKVLKHMQDTNHQWHMGNGVMRVPDMEDLRVNARSLLTKAIYDKNQCTNVGTGGFVAYKLPWGLQLTFQLAWGGN
jgi:hypothetical protein